MKSFMKYIKRPMKCMKNFVKFIESFMNHEIDEVLRQKKRISLSTLRTFRSSKVFFFWKIGTERALFTTYRPAFKCKQRLFISCLCLTSVHMNFDLIYQIQDKPVFSLNFVYDRTRLPLNLSPTFRACAWGQESVRNPAYLHAAADGDYYYLFVAEGSHKNFDF